MARPRWQQPAATMPAGRLWLIWDRFVAIWAALNLAVVFFDITYVPLRTFSKHLSSKKVARLKLYEQ